MLETLLIIAVAYVGIIAIAALVDIHKGNL